MSQNLCGPSAQPPSPLSSHSKFSQGGSRVVSGSDDGKWIRIWNVTTREMEAELKGHTDSVTSVAFSQDSSQVISGSRGQHSPNLECDDRGDGG